MMCDISHKVPGVFTDKDHNIFIGFTDYPVPGPDECIVRVRASGVSTAWSMVFSDDAFRFVVLTARIGNKEA